MSYRTTNEYKLENPIDHLLRVYGDSKIADRHKWPKNYYYGLSSSSSSSSSFNSNSCSGHAEIPVVSKPYLNRMYYGGSAIGNVWF